MAYSSWSVVFGEQPTAAKWNILGTNDASFNDGTGLNNGAVQQIQYTTFTAAVTGTTVIPYDDTIPQITEGNELMTQAITPKATTNVLVIEANFFGSYSAANTDTILAIFQDATANALAVSASFVVTAGGRTSLYVRHTMLAGTTSSTTFRVRGGGSNAGTITMNGDTGARKFGAINKSSIIVTEYKA